jgi:hypothetical protein
LLKSTLHWNGALEKCRSFNADLPSIRDATENEWIVDNILKSQAISHVHLGKTYVGRPQAAKHASSFYIALYCPTERYINFGHILLSLVQIDGGDK